MDFKEKFLEEWTKSNGGLITPAVASKIYGVNRSVITKRKDIKKYIIEDNTFVSLIEILNKKDIKPRSKRKNIASASACRKPDGTIKTTAKASEGTVETSATPDGKLTAKAQTIKAIKKQ